MKEVLDLIQKKKLEFAQAPLFKYMQDKSIHPKQRLSFAPCIVPLAMEFGEQCKYVFTEDVTTNELQKIINQHAREEHHHWQWLLEDLEKLGFNDLQSYSKSIKFLWGEETKKTRDVCRLTDLYTFQADPIYKLVAIQVAEVTANIFFTVAETVAEELQEITQKYYTYFGGCHLDKENSHQINQPEKWQIITQIQLSQEARQKAFEIVETLFQAYLDVMNEWLEFAKKQDLQALQLQIV
ncbi:hypothetical protein NIES4074_22460 [Cylindrospermum sp. NIES-4074]|nr:hypothetical protein NIES4074_22460 [Cylindrospermum sp. NIES-4074]